MSFEDKVRGMTLERLMGGNKVHCGQDLLSAINHTRHGNSIAAAHRKSPPSLAGRLAGYIVPGMSNSGPEWVAQMTPVERHAELVYAETLHEKVNTSLPLLYTDVNVVTGRVCLGLCTLGIG